MNDQMVNEVAQTEPKKDGIVAIKAPGIEIVDYPIEEGATSLQDQAQSKEPVTEEIK